MVVRCSYVAPTLSHPLGPLGPGLRDSQSSGDMGGGLGDDRLGGSVSEHVGGRGQGAGHTMQPHGRMGRLRCLCAYTATSVCRFRISMSTVCCCASGCLHALPPPPPPRLRSLHLGTRLSAQTGAGPHVGRGLDGRGFQGAGPWSGRCAGRSCRPGGASGQRRPSAPRPVARDAALDGAGPGPEPAAGAGEERRRAW